MSKLVLRVVAYPPTSIFASLARIFQGSLPSSGQRQVVKVPWSKT
jgi:hypothetical protein